MAICKFNIGDKVRRLNHHNNCGDSKFEVGQVGKIVKIRDETFVDVKVNGIVNEWNDVKNLELVDTETFKFKIGDRVKVVNPAHNFKNKHRGKEFTIRSYNPNGKDTFNEPHYGVDGDTCYVWQESELELVEKATLKYKVGDRVIVEKSNVDRTFGSHKGKTGVITAVGNAPYPYRVHMDFDGSNLWCEVAGYEATDEKIVITHDGKTTTATKYCEDGSKVTATARCAPEDTFDFNVGAKLAMERLMEKVDSPTNYEWRVVDRKPVPGDYFRLKRVDYPNRDKLGDILKADGVKGDMIYVLEKNHPHCKSKTSDFHWNYTRSEYDVVEKVTANEPKTPEPPTPKYYNGKVVCVSNGNVPEDLIIGKIYTFVDGLCKNERGTQITSSPIKDCDDLNRRFVTNVKFIPLVEDNKPLTIEEIRKMDGQKVYAIRLDENKRETPEHSFSGWHTVNVEKGRLTDTSELHWDISSNGEAHGYHAYRTKPTK